MERLPAGERAAAGRAGRGAAPGARGLRRSLHRGADRGAAAAARRRAVRDAASDRVLAEALVTALAASRTDLDRFWFDWRGGRRRRRAMRRPSSTTSFAAVAEYRPRRAARPPVLVRPRAVRPADRRDRGDLGGESPRPTTGRRSTPRSPRSGGWARRWRAARRDAVDGGRGERLVCGPAVPFGCNFVPSTAVNALEMWQAATFDAATIDRELGVAAGLGMNARAGVPPRPAVGRSGGVRRAARRLPRHRRAPRHRCHAGAVRIVLGRRAGRRAAAATAAGRP